MRSFTRQLLVAVLAVVVLGSCLAACGWPGTHAASGGNNLVVRDSKRVVARLTLPQLQHLPQVEVATPQSQGAQVQKGPTVRSILQTAGVTGIKKLRVEGRDPAQTLTAADLTDQLILNVTKRNTLKLAGTELGRDRWVRDVTMLIVNP
jgi:hypothetical protein